MAHSAVFDRAYVRRRNALLAPLLADLQPHYSAAEQAALRVVGTPPAALLQTRGQGFVNCDALETLLGNLLELVAPGSHNVRAGGARAQPLRWALAAVADQLYAAVRQSLAAADEAEDGGERALHTTFALLHALPDLRRRSLWNRFASLRDPAVWDAYLVRQCRLPPERVAEIDFVAELEAAIRSRDMEHYRAFMRDLGCERLVEYQLRLVTATYPGWRVLLYHDVAHALAASAAPAANGRLAALPVPFLPRAIAELGGRYYQADLHPETRVGDANFLDHPHRGITTGQTGSIGSGCHLLPCTMGGLSEKVQQRHPLVGDFVFIGTDVGLFGSVRIGDGCVIGPNTEIHGRVEVGARCHIGASAFVGTIWSGGTRPGRIVLGEGVRVGAGTILENGSQLDLVIPAGAEIPARSYVTNDGFGRPQYMRG